MRATVAEAAQIHRGAWAFLAETIAPVEMALRGYQQSNDALRALAATLDEQVRERTRDLDESLEELKRADRARQLLLERLVSAQEDERRRIAGDIHDDSIQVITAAYLRVELVRQGLGDDPHAETLAKLDEALRASIDRLRHMIFELRPAMLDTAGLAATIQEHLEQWGRQTETAYTLENRLRGEPGTLDSDDALPHRGRGARERPQARPCVARRRRARARRERVRPPRRRRRRRPPRPARARAQRPLRSLDDGRAGGDGGRMVPGGEQRARARDDRRRVDAGLLERRPPCGELGRGRSRSTRCSRSAF